MICFFQKKIGVALKEGHIQLVNNIYIYMFNRMETCYLPGFPMGENCIQSMWMSFPE